ncbi:hypothetical protein DMN91_000256 [Ooceraea biroi]|uniref:Cytochrome-b5 reductase n=1 Tax=Ooceraea biroi TaxID=2015173 RepID=A0A3L8E159_OOCBI|nr:hypothetical protein DMN91_000256 [Ooceraea biroi]
MSRSRTETTSAQKNDSSKTQLEMDKDGKDKCQSYDTDDIEEKVKKVNVTTSSPTRLLAKSSLVLPTGFIKPKRGEQVKAKVETMSSSGSATVSAADGNGSPQMGLGLQIQDGNPRNKTALAPGHSLMDWIRLGNSGVDLTGVGGIPQVVTLSELANHNKQTDAWIAIRGVVFNVTRYMNFHPGGIDELMKGVGKDATKLFDNVHSWVNYQSILQKCVVGRLCRGPSSASSSIAEKSVTGGNNRSPVTIGLSKSSAAQKPVTENSSDLPNIDMNWRQTSNSITLFYQSLCDYTAPYYQLQRLTDSRLIFRLILEKYVIVHEFELIADVEWPPTCKRDFDTMQVDFTFVKKIKDIWKSQGNHASSRESVISKRTYKEYEVLSNTPLCKLVHLLVVRAKDFVELIPIGRHIEVKMNVMGMEISRSYTPVPPCLHPDDMAPNYKSDCICLMIKHYPNGALSPSIIKLQPGQAVTMSNGLGAFATESFDRYSVIHMLAGGTGLTAMLGIIQRALARRSVKLINLLNFNKDEANMFYVAQLDKVSTEKCVQTLGWEPHQTYEFDD